MSRERAICCPVLWFAEIARPWDAHGYRGRDPGDGCHPAADLAAAFEVKAVAPLWKSVPSWDMFGELDRNRPVMQHFAGRLSEILVARGADDQTAQFAAQIALACYQTGKTRRRNNPHALVVDTRDTLKRVLWLGR